LLHASRGSCTGGLRGSWFVVHAVLNFGMGLGVII